MSQAKKIMFIALFIFVVSSYELFKQSSMIIKYPFLILIIFTSFAERVWTNAWRSDPP